MNMRALLVLALCVVAFSAFAASEGGDPNHADVAVPAHDVARGTVLSPEDLVTKPLSLMQAGDGFVRAIADAAGKETKRALRAGEFIRTSDLKRPTVVAKGSTVTMVFDAPGMRLSAIGRALAEGGQGDTITVLNPTSYRRVEATVVAPGFVRVTGPSAPPPAPIKDAALQP